MKLVILYSRKYRWKKTLVNLENCKQITKVFSQIYPICNTYVYFICNPFAKIAKFSYALFHQCFLINYTTIVCMWLVTY